MIIVPELTYFLFIFDFYFFFSFYFSANQLCHTSKSISVPNGEKDQIRITAVKFGCWSEGERTDAEGVKTTTYMKLSCAAEGTNVVAETFTDDKCTKVATGDKKRTATFTDKDQTNVEVKDGKTVTKIDADISVTSTCNGGSSAPVVANATLTLNSGITTTFSLATIAAVSIAIAALL